MSVNDEFDLGSDLGLDDDFDKKVVVPPSKAAKKKALPRSEPIVEEEAEAPFIDPEDDRENWPTIHLEMEDGKPNYEFLSAHGTKKNGDSFGHDLQVMRGVDVQVPPSIVYALQDTVAAYYVPRRNPETGRTILNKQERSSIPWRLIRGGKYCR